MIKRGDVLLSESSKFTLPLLMVHGEADCVTS